MAALLLLPLIIGVLTIILPDSEGAATGIGFAFLALSPYAFLAFVKVWHAGSPAGVVDRWLSRFAMLATYALFFAIFQFFTWVESDPDVRSGVRKGFAMVEPARLAIAEACWYGGLRPELDNLGLGLKPPGDYAGPFTQSMTAYVESPSTARVEVVFKELRWRSIFGGTAVEEGATFVATAECTDGQTTWTKGGTVPSHYHSGGHDGR